MKIVMRRAQDKPIQGSSNPPRAKLWRDIFRRRGKSVLTLMSATMLALGCHPGSARANVAGGIIPNSPAVTVTDNGDGTVTMDNGIVDITINKTDARIGSIHYTLTSGGVPQTVETDKYNVVGRENYYYGGTFLGSGPLTYSLATNGGDYADVKFITDTTGTDGVFEAHYSMLRGSPGFYTTGIQRHRSQDIVRVPPNDLTAFGIVSRVEAPFNWLSQGPLKNFLVGANSGGGSGYAVPGAAHEMSVYTAGGLMGQYSDKFTTGDDHQDKTAWGWSSVTPHGLNYSRWMMTNIEFSDGGPLKRDVGAYTGNNLDNAILTGELGQGNDGRLAAGELWTKVTGPFFNYLNHIDSADPRAADESTAANALLADAIAQDAAEKAAWPYQWFTSPDYALAAGRGTVTGQLVISDTYNRNPPVAGTTVLLIKQPASSTGGCDFTKWLKPYQYITHTDSAGRYTFNDVRADTGYTLWAYGPGAPGTFQSQRQTGGDAEIELVQPSPTQSINVTGGSTTNVPTMTWNVKRYGPTVFEIGVSDRKAGEFRHGEDFWKDDPTPNSGGANPTQRFPDGIWGGPPLFGAEFPNGLTYTAGASRWSTDWNYVLSSFLGVDGAYHPATATIHFNLPSTPAAGAQASLFLGVAGAGFGTDIVSVNGTSLCGNASVTTAPTVITGSAYAPTYTDDSATHLSNHGPYCDERFTFPASAASLHAGDNTVTINMNSTNQEAFLMVDYLRFELAGYIPPPPSFVRVFTGNNRNLITWPVVPGATRYAVYRSTTSGSGYGALSTGYIGSVSGDESSIMTFSDTTAANNTQYYYVIQSLNPDGASANSVETAAKPLSSKPTTAPVTPAGVNITALGHRSATVSWTTSPGADYYKVYRSTISDDRAGYAVDLRKNLLADTLLYTATSYTDTTPTDGRTYAYSVVAVNAAGSSAESADAQATPLPAAPGPVGSLTAVRSADKTSVTLTWTPASSGATATAFAIYEATTANGPFTFPSKYLMSTPAASFVAKGPNGVALSATQTVYFQVTAVNAGGYSTPVTVASAP